MDKESKYNTIFFDAGVVLFDTRTSRNERIRNYLNHFRGEIDENF